MSPVFQAGPMAEQLQANVEAERSILGAILLDNRALDIAIDKLKPDDCSHDYHKRIYRQMIALRNSQLAIDLVTLSEQLTCTRELEFSGGAAYVAELIDGRQNITNVEHYARIVKEKSLLCSIIRATQTIQQKALEGGADPDAILVDANLEIRKLQENYHQSRESQLGSVYTAELFASHELNIDWLAWPIAATGLSSILDASPKIGKTRFFLEGILASRMNRPFLNIATKPMRVIYVSEQSEASLAMQVREVGFTGDEPIQELRWITREFWSRFTFPEFLEKVERQFIRGVAYNALIFDTWHTVARLEDENSASEVNRLGNLTIDVAARNKLALELSRHDRKSGGDVGMSGRSSIQLSGLVDVILHLVRVPGQPAKRKLELLGRIPSLPNHQIIELIDGKYINFGDPGPVSDRIDDRIARVRDWLDEQSDLSADQIVAKFAARAPTIQISAATAKRYRGEARKKR